MDRASSHASLALLLRYEHPDRARDERKTRSVCGIRQALSHDRSALHAVGLGLEKLCECPAKHRDGSDLGTVCPCFSAADLSATALYLSKNDLTVGSVEVLSAFHALETLSLADNVIERVPEALRGMHKLKRLSLAGNPVMTRPHATEQILAFRPSLTELNGRRVDEREKQMARDVYKEECVLANICHLLGLLRTEEPGEGWVRALDRVERVLVGGVSSLEQLSDDLFLFDETASFRWGDEATCGVSRNHELTVVANTAWVGGLAFFMSDNPDFLRNCSPIPSRLTWNVVGKSRLRPPRSSKRRSLMPPRRKRIWVVPLPASRTTGSHSFRACTIGTRYAQGHTVTVSTGETTPCRPGYRFGLRSPEYISLPLSLSRL